MQYPAGKNPVWVLTHESLMYIRKIQREAAKYDSGKLAKEFVEQRGYKYPSLAYDRVHLDMQKAGIATPAMLIHSGEATLGEWTEWLNKHREIYFVDEPMADPVGYAKKLVAKTRNLRSRFSEE